MAKPRKATKHQQRLRKQRARLSDSAALGEAYRAMQVELALDDPPTDEELRAVLTKSEPLFRTPADWATGIGFVGHSTDSANPAVRVIALELQEQMAWSAEENTAAYQQLMVQAQIGDVLTPDTLTDLDAFIAACRTLVQMD